MDWLGERAVAGLHRLADAVEDVANRIEDWLRQRWAAESTATPEVRQGE